MPIQQWNRFFHTRLDSEGCKFAGWLRIAFALIFIADRVLLSFDIELLLSPSTGLVPLWLGREHEDISENMYTIFQLAPESDVLFWVVHLIGIVQGVLLGLGIAPRFQLLGIYLNLISFQHHNQVIWDGEDMMFKAFCMSFLLMPLHRRTVYDGFGLKNTGTDHDDDWPMWPVRLFQIQMSFIYIGASLGKLTGPAWTSGAALYFITYSTDFYPGIYNPDFIFNKLGPLKFLTWSSLLLELSSWSLVWVPKLRVPIVVSMIFFHIGIEVTMNMHCFEWLAITGWFVFFLQPKSDRVVSKGVRGKVTDIFILWFVFWAVIHEVPSIMSIDMVPKSTKPMLERFNEWRWSMRDTLHPWLNPVGAYQDSFDMYDGGWGWTRYSFAAEMIVDEDTVKDEWYSPRWIEMPYLKRKRNMRLMNYFSVFEQDGDYSFSLRKQLLRLLAAEFGDKHEDGFDRITLYLAKESAPNPNQDGGWFDDARTPPLREEIPIISLYPPPICQDHTSACAMVKAKQCDERLSKACPLSCGACTSKDFDDADYQWEFHTSEDFEEEQDDDDFEDDEENYEDENDGGSPGQDEL